MFRIRLTKAVCALLCILLALGAAGAAAAEAGMIVVPTYVSTWAELNDAAANGAAEVIVTADIAYGENDETVVFKNAVNIHSMEGEQHTIDGGGKRILSIQGPDEVTPVEGVSVLGNLTLQNGDASGDDAGFIRPGYGGAVFVQGDLRAEHCTFKGSRALNGGAVYTAGSLSMNTCVVGGNAALQDGGGIYVETGTVELTGSMFVGNQAPEGCGGVLCTYGDVTNIVDSQFMENMAKFGGAVYSFAGETTVTGGMIVGNYASETGGGVYTEEGKVADMTGSVMGNTPNDIVQP